jgi:hypothetical protein
MDKVIADIASKLGIAAMDALPYLIRYTIVDSIVGLIVWPILFVATWKIVFFAWHRLEGAGRDDRAMARAIVSVAGIIVAVISLVGFFSNIATLIEPRGYLINKAISTVGGSK